MLNPPSQSSQTAQTDGLNLGELRLEARLILGTGRYSSHDILLKSLRNAQTQLVTMAIRRVTLNASSSENLLSLLRQEGLHLLPNTAGCHTVRDALLTAELAREALGEKRIKLEVIADEDTLYPDAEKLLQAAAELVEKGFEVLPYCTDDPVLCRKLQDLGCVAVMPLAAPIGTGLGILNPYNLQRIREQVSIPLIIDAGVGTPSDVAFAMELGCDAVMLDTAIAKAKNPALMARAMHHACLAGRMAYLAGRIPKRQLAQASSPISGLVHGLAQKTP